MFARLKVLNSLACEFRRNTPACKSGLFRRARKEIFDISNHVSGRTRLSLSLSLSLSRGSSVISLLSSSERARMLNSRREFPFRARTEVRNPARVVLEPRRFRDRVPETETRQIARRARSRACQSRILIRRLHLSGATRMARTCGRRLRQAY